MLQGTPNQLLNGPIGDGIIGYIWHRHCQSGWAECVRVQQLEKRYMRGFVVTVPYMFTGHALRQAVHLQLSQLRQVMHMFLLR
jgi:hypothetical protein